MLNPGQDYYHISAFLRISSLIVIWASLSTGQTSEDQDKGALLLVDLVRERERRGRERERERESKRLMMER